MKNKIGVAIIGCGVIAPTHAESYILDSSVKLIAACDIQEERAKAFAEKYGAEYATTSADEVFADPSVDAVSICTPHYNHAELCLKALAAGKDVLCEKPLANTISGINLLRRAQREYPERIFAGVFQHRYNPVFKLLKELVASGGFGRVLTASMLHRCLRSEAYYNADFWRGTRKYERGGVLINQAIHYLDLFQWIMGGVKEVNSFSGNLTHQGIIETEDTIVGSVLFKNGAFGTIEATNSARQSWDTQLQITGSEGFVYTKGGKVVSADFKDESIMPRLKAAEAELAANVAGEVGKSHYGYGHPVQIADFIECVRTRKAPFVSAIDASEAARLTLALYRGSK